MIEIIKGGEAKDFRGNIRFVNDFDMSLVKRFYIIKNSDIELIRGWRGHRVEQRWFYVLTGSFILNIIKIDDWNKPSSDLPIEKKIIRSQDMQIIHVPKGYATAFQAMEEGSELMVFADFGIENAPNDNYLWAQDYFSNLRS
ncbi:WxcM-like domain-containing protein [Sphingobacterium sp. 1.A.4]|uniref:WxcM-like domain-containing protein n=1 Tax=Sphingobacterium sp. 1.A.4 TaxID=2044603 RepID=UPI000C0BED86|nr:WxcM-like domain-containing protein [Sphingobacterium sp. 1.A.4]